MLLPLKAICQQKDIRKDGTSLVYIQYCYSSEKRTLLNTAIAVPPRYWNKKKECVSELLPISSGNVAELNAELTRLKRLAEDLIVAAVNADVQNIGAYVKEKFNPKLDSANLCIQYNRSVPADLKKKHPDFFAEIDSYIQSKERKIGDKARASIESMRDHLWEYQRYSHKEISFASLDYDFYERFIDFLTFDYIQRRRKETFHGLKINTIGKTIRQLRSFILDRARRKIIAPIDLSSFHIPAEETDNIYLSFSEIEAMYHTDLSGYTYLIPYRDLFVLACLTGLRYSDFSTLQPEELRGNMLYRKQTKTNAWVVIPMRDKAKVVFEQYFRDKLLSLTNPEFNRHIKTVGKLAGIDEVITFSHGKGNKHIKTSRPKHDWITTHTARRSFCTNEFLAGTPVKLIMSISGHKTESNFYRYIKISAEEAARKVENLWLSRTDI